MFTGLIEATGQITQIEPANANKMHAIFLASPFDPKDPIILGESIAVDGCCLTVAQITQTELQFDCSRETLNKTNLGNLKVGNQVHLERALTFQTRLGGHLVSGHVDGIGQVKSSEFRTDGFALSITFPKELGKTLVVPKGSICVNGVSLTVNDLNFSMDTMQIDLMLIPTTLEKTHLGQLKPNDSVNLEFDLIAKHIAKLMQPYFPKSNE